MSNYTIIQSILHQKYDIEGSNVVHHGAYVEITEFWGGVTNGRMQHAIHEGGDSSAFLVENV